MDQVSDQQTRTDNKNTYLKSSTNYSNPLDAELEQLLAKQRRYLKLIILKNS